MDGKVEYRGSVTGDGPSPAIWADIDLKDAFFDFARGVLLQDDFVLFEENNHGWLIAGTNPTNTLPADELYGVVEIGATGADNDEAFMVSGNNEQGAFKIDQDSSQRCAFECRVKLNSVAAETAFVFGLSEEGLAAADSLANDTGALGDKDWVVFHSDCAAPTALDFVTRVSGTAAQVHGAGLQTLVAATWYKLGFIFDGVKTIDVYIDGAQVDTLDISASTSFPDSEELSVILGVKTGEGVAKQFDVDWVRVYMDRAPY